MLHNPENLGFVGTVNRGLRDARGDVVILNSDTAVTEGWLDRLAAAAALPDVATRHAAHQPRFDLHAAARRSSTRSSSRARTRGSTSAPTFVREHSLRLLPEVITGVGFCMYVTRLALDLCGLLDEETFGRGYGEEVDFCLRASRLGLRHLVEDSTFVYHRGGVSFGDAQSEGWARSSAIIDARYPFFRPNNTRERATDPLARVVRRARARARTSATRRRPHVLHILHSRLDATGGTEKYVAALLATLEHEFDFSVLYPVESGFVLRTVLDRRRPAGRARVPAAGRGHPGDAHERRSRSARRCVAALDLFEFDAVHIHNLIGHSLAPFDALADFPGPVVCSVHDLFLACPNFSLLYMKTDPCGIPDDLSVCARCLADIAESPMPGSPPMPNISRRRTCDEFRATIAEPARHRRPLGVPEQSAADYFLRVYDPEPARWRSSSTAR